MALRLVRQPSRPAVIRSWREPEALWKPPVEKDNARFEPGAGEAGAEGRFDKEQSAPHGPRKAIPFHRAPRTCCACGQHLPDGEGDTCRTCLTWDRLLRGMALTGPALGDVLAAGGRR
jgi:hypothetical protein